MPTIHEKVNNPFIGTIYEAGYGFSFAWIMNHPGFDIDMKYVAAVYGLYFKHDGSGSCTVHRDKLISEIAHMKTKAFIDARNRLMAAGVINVSARRKTYQENSDRRSWDTNEITLNLTPPGFQENDRAGVKYGNILSYGFGMLPRVIFLDESLEKIDKVIASYVFSNMGRIQEYLLSGVKLRKSLQSLGKNNTLKEISRYQFDKSLTRLDRFFTFRRLSNDEILDWRHLKHQEESAENTHGDYYLITIKSGIKYAAKGDGNIYSSNIPNGFNLGTEEESDDFNRSNLGTVEQGTEEEGTLEEGTVEQGTPINSLLSKEVYKQNKYSLENSLYHQNPNGVDDVRTAEDKSKHILLEKCPKEIRERLGETVALKELDGLYNLLGQISEEEYYQRVDRLGVIIDQLYQIALTEPELEEAALAVNVAYMILHRTKKTGQFNNPGRYIRSILEKTESDSGFVKAPVREVSGYQAIMDGFKISDNGAGQRPLLMDEPSGDTEDKGIDSYIDDLKDWILCTGTEKDGCVYSTDTPLPLCLTKDRQGRRMLSRILHSFFRKSAYEVLDSRYEDLDDAILLVQKAIIRLFDESEIFLKDGSLVDKVHISKKLQSLLYLDAKNELFIKTNIYEKVTSLYLNARSEQELIIPEKWLITVLVNEIRCAPKEEKVLSRNELLDPVPAFKEAETSKERIILNDGYRSEKVPEKTKVSETFVTYEDGEGRFVGYWDEKAVERSDTKKQTENLKKLKDYTAGVAAKLNY